MKKILFITGMLLAIILFTSQKEVKSDDIFVIEQVQATGGINATTDIQLCIERISGDLQSSSLQIPYRQVQVSNSYNIRSAQNTIRLWQEIRQKEANQLQKVLAHTSKLQTFNYSSLLTRTGYHIYALRKIII